MKRELIIKIKKIKFNFDKLIKIKILNHLKIINMNGGKLARFKNNKKFSKEILNE